MKPLFFVGSLVLALLAASFLLAQVYTTEEYVVEGDSYPGATEQVEVITTQPGVVTSQGTVVTTRTGVPVVTAGPPVVLVPGEQEIYVGMTRQNVRTTLGAPSDIQRFSAFRARKQGIYDEIWTYAYPTGTTYVYIKERKVLRVEYR